jgi:hypothetical protein
LDHACRASDERARFITVIGGETDADLVGTKQVAVAATFFANVVLIPALLRKP